MEEKRIYTSGEMPESPIITDVVTHITDIRAEPARETEGEEEPVPEWSYVVEKVESKDEYYKTKLDEAKENFFILSDVIFELDGE